MGGGEHAVDVAELPRVPIPVLRHDFTCFDDSPARLQRLDDEVAEGDNRPESQYQQYAEKKICHGEHGAS